MTTPQNPIRLGIPSPGPSYRGALASRDFRLLFVGQLGSEIGNGAVLLALPWLILNISVILWATGCWIFLVSRGISGTDRCAVCGYDLRGTVAASKDTCPECGNAVPFSK